MKRNPYLVALYVTALASGLVGVIVNRASAYALETTSLEDALSGALGGPTYFLSEGTKNAMAGEAIGALLVQIGVAALLFALLLAGIQWAFEAIHTQSEAPESIP